MPISALTKRARWSETEWDSVCLSIYRNQPVASMTNVNLIKRDDVINAMRTTLPEERWHRSVNMTHLRPKLKERFIALRGQLQQIEREQQDTLRQQEESERAQSKTRQRVDVFSPMIDVIAERLFARMQPMMEKYVDSRLNGASQSESHEAALDVHRPIKVSKIKLGVVGLLPIQEQEIKKRFAEYPFVELTFYDKERGQKGFKAWAHNLDMVFLLVSKVDHGYENQLDKFTRVPGRGTTSMIRSIEVWLATNGRPVTVSN